MVCTENIPPLSAEVTALKDEGNDFFRAGEYLKAAGSYTKAIKAGRPTKNIIPSTILPHLV